MTTPSSQATEKKIREALATTAISRRDLLVNDPGLRQILNWLHLNSWKSGGRFLLAASVPLIIFTAITVYEGRFELGSVTWPSEELGRRRVRGMSFLGDTMVWPFIILMPILFGLLNKALSHFESFFLSIDSTLSHAWISKNIEEYTRIANETRAIVQSRGIWKHFRRIAIFIGFFFFASNALICTFAAKYSLYTTSEPYVETIAGSGTYEPRLLPDFAKEIAKPGTTSTPRQPGKKAEDSKTVEEIPVPKWDTDLSTGFGSWLTARIWALTFGYFWIPIVMYKIFNLVAALYHFAKELSAHPNSIEARPLSPQNTTGLVKLASLATSLTYPMTIIGAMLTMPFIKENTDPSTHDILLFLLFIPLLIAFFFLPLWGFHKSLVATKEQHLQKSSDLVEKTHSEFLQEIRSPSLDTDGLSRLEIAMRGSSEIHQRISKMPVWPFAISNLYRLITAGLIPVLIPILFDLALKSLLD